jgi:hypothetical protein
MQRSWLRVVAASSLGLGLVLIALFSSPGTGGAQTSGWRVVQTSDSSLYLVHDGVRQLLIPGVISDEELAALPEDVPIGGDAFPDLPAPTPLTITVVATPTPFPPPARSSVEAEGHRVTVLDVQRGRLPTPRNTRPRGTEWLTVRLGLDNTGPTLMSTNPLDFPVQLANLVMYERESTSDPEALKCCDLPLGASVVGNVWYQVPGGVAQTTLFWTHPAIPRQIDIR